MNTKLIAPAVAFTASTLAGSVLAGRVVRHFKQNGDVTPVTIVHSASPELQKFIDKHDWHVTVNHLI